ncbi:MAG: GTPase Era [Firmicutes bacterium]|nr:GTPase Era [Bacillota bacterium]
MFKFGKVVLIGEPNVGKSSLVNKMVGEDLSIVTNIPGTTREEIRGIKSHADYQIVFLDVPGMQQKRNDLDKFMAKSISTALQDADIVLYVLDGLDIKPEHIKKIGNYKNINKPFIVAVNKIDKTNFAHLYPKLSQLNSLDFVLAIIPISCKTGFNIDVLEGEIVKNLPTGNPQHEQDDFTTQTTKKMVEEIIRGELMQILKAEIPHGIAVKVSKWKEKSKEIEIYADIFCAKPSHKPIIIGAKGHVLKDVGTRSRQQIQDLTGKHIRLFTHVLVREDWKNKKDILTDLGYTNK